jgi:hypothetical protein
MGVIIEVVERANRKRPVAARREWGESRARPAVLATAKDMAAAQTCSLRVSVEWRSRLCGRAVCVKHNGKAVPLRQESLKEKRLLD